MSLPTSSTLLNFILVDGENYMYQKFSAQRLNIVNLKFIKDSFTIKAIEVHHVFFGLIKQLALIRSPLKIWPGTLQSNTTSNSSVDKKKNSL